MQTHTRSSAAVPSTPLVFCSLPCPSYSGVLMVVIVWYTTHLSRKAISNALLTGGDEVAIETVADTEVAELLRCAAWWPFCCKNLLCMRW